ncbi:MAG: amidohydrolase family protein [Planctomycetota bacterium]|jgi:imidazolonepropionase-like amidohydrolase
MALGQSPEAITAGRYLAPDGTLKADAVVSLESGRIKAVGTNKATVEGRETVDYPGGVLCPGLIDIGSQPGAYGNAVEVALAVDPAASAMDSIDWSHRDFRRSVEAGVTAVMVTPSPSNLVTGLAATVKTVRLPGHDPVLRTDGPLTFALGSTVWSYDRAPTSRIGSLAMLRDALDEARGGGGHELMRAFVAGTLEGYVTCERAMDVSSALRALRVGNDGVTIRYNGEEHDLVGELSSLARAIVTGPLDFEMTPRHLAAPGVFATGGVPVVFGAGMPGGSAHGLRRSAALAASFGMKPADARRSITVLPAVLSGVANRIGSIHPGNDADLVVFSDDPLRMDARVLAVYIDGARVYDAALSQSGHSHSGSSRGVTP